ncbi:MAG: isochorismatase family cysteine hydrolase [Candidatus Micrarchaeota archaeon]
MKNAVLLVIDVQNDFCSSRGILARNGFELKKIRESVFRLAKLVNVARQARIPIVFTKLVYDEKVIPENNYRRLKIKGVEGLCAPNSWGAEFFLIKPRRSEKVFVKNYYSAFFNTGLDAWLSKKKIKIVIITGVTTHVCPLLTSADAYYRGFELVAVSDCLGSYEAQDWSLKYMQKQFAAAVVSSSVLASIFREKGELK